MKTTSHGTREGRQPGMAVRVELLRDDAPVVHDVVGKATLFTSLLLSGHPEPEILPVPERCRSRPRAFG
jgi:hypothetical protein